MDPTRLRPNPWNTNIVSPENERKLDEAIRRVGMFKPVLVRRLPDGELEIVGGQHRAEAAQRLGIKEVPVYDLGEIDEAKAKEIGVLDNSRYGVDDSLSLAELLKEIGNPDQLAAFLPFTDTDLKAIFASSDVDLTSLRLTDDKLPDPDADHGAASKAPKTHTIMRFKVPLGDSEWIAKLVSDTQHRYGFTTSDDLTNAGDALVHILRDLTGKDPHGD